VDFRILGPLRMGADGRSILEGQRQQRLVAALLLASGEVVTVAQLVDAIWDERPPATAKRQVQNAISALRRQLPGNAAPVPVIETVGRGYRIPIGPGQLDALVFAERAARSRDLTGQGRTGQAAELMRSALALWRGPALAAITGRVVRAGAARLDEQRLALTEDCVDLELTLGRHSDLVGELTELVATNPLRERLVGQLMVALYRCGRRADALQRYRHLGAQLADELGLDPGASIQRVHSAILRDEPSVAAQGAARSAAAPAIAPRPAAPVTAPPPAATAAPTPAQLPLDVDGFVGRDEELAWLDAWTGREDGRATAVVISAIAGTAGVGKTALAVHWAHRVADRFPDGQLYVNLRGFDPASAPVPPAEAIRGFLDALGVARHRIPTDLAAQVGLYRSLIAGRRMLVVLDNARDTDQVRPLLPGGAGCLVLVTSRNRLTGLVAAEGAHPLTLGLLTAAAARRLLARRLGSERVAAEPAAVGEIVDRCAGLPLALSIAAAHAATRPAFPLTGLADDLGDARRRLDALRGDDAASDVRAVFSWSYESLTEPAARLFRLLGLHPGPDLTVPAAASLAALPPQRAAQLLAELTHAHLVSESAAGRYACHDLLRAYARERAHTLDPPADRQAAVTRLLEHYLHSAYAASALLRPACDHLVVLEPPAWGVTAEQPVGLETALAWFAAEHRVLLAAVGLASGSGRDTRTWQLALGLATFLDRQGHWDELAAMQSAALAAAQRLGDLPREANAHSALANAYIKLGRYADADRHLRQALDLLGDGGDPRIRGRVQHILAWILSRQDSHAASVRHSRTALELYSEVDHRHGQAGALNLIGWSLAHLGDHQEALAHCQRALALHQELGSATGQAATWDSIGYVHLCLAQYEQAATCYGYAIDLLRGAGDRWAEADVLSHLGNAREAAGRTDGARTAWREALAILTELDHSDAHQLRARLQELDGGPVGHPPATRT